MIPIGQTPSVDIMYAHLLTFALTLGDPAGGEVGGRGSGTACHKQILCVFFLMEQFDLSLNLQISAC